MKLYKLYEQVLAEALISGVYYHGGLYPKIKWGASPEDYDRSLFGYGIYATTSKEEAMYYAVGERDNEYGYVFSMNLTNLNVVNFNNEPVSDEIIKKLESDNNFYNAFEVKFDDSKFNFDEYGYELGDNIMYDWDREGDKETYMIGKFIKNGKYWEQVSNEAGFKKDEILAKIKSYNDVGELSQVKIYDEVIRKDEIFNSYNKLYFYVSAKLNSLKEGAKFMVTLGIDGFKTKSVGVDGVFLKDSDYIINILNPDKITNVNAEKVSEKDYFGQEDEDEDEESQEVQEFFRQNNVDPEELSYIDSGDFGEAYSIGDGRVLKITRSKSEFGFAKQLVGKDVPALDGFVDFYAANIVDNQYYIIMEELEEDYDIEDLYYVLEDLLNDEGLPIQYLHMLDTDELNLDEDMLKFISDMEDINYSYRYLGIEASDIKPDNLGVDKNGKIKAFDIDDRSINELYK